MESDKFANKKEERGEERVEHMVDMELVEVLMAVDSVWVRSTCDWV